MGPHRPGLRQWVGLYICRTDFNAQTNTRTNLILIRINRILQTRKNSVTKYILHIKIDSKTVNLLIKMGANNTLIIIFFL